MLFGHYFVTDRTLVRRLVWFLQTRHTPTHTQSAPKGPSPSNDGPFHFLLAARWQRVCLRATHGLGARRAMTGPPASRSRSCPRTSRRSCVTPPSGFDTPATALGTVNGPRS